MFSEGEFGASKFDLDRIFMSCRHLEHDDVGYPRIEYTQYVLNIIQGYPINAVVAEQFKAKYKQELSRNPNSKMYGIIPYDQVVNLIRECK